MIPKFSKDILNIIIKYYFNIEKYLDKINWNRLSCNANIPHTFFLLARLARAGKIFRRSKI